MAFDQEALKRDYETLGVRPEASVGSIHKRYRQLVKRWHPDRYDEGSRAHSSASRQIRVINSAYAQIKNAPLQRPAAAEAKRTAMREAKKPKTKPTRDAPPRRRGEQALVMTAGFAAGLFGEFMWPVGREIFGPAGGWLVLPMLGAAVAPFFKAMAFRDATDRPRA